MKRRQNEKLRPGKHTPMCNFFNELSFLKDHMANLEGSKAEILSTSQNVSSSPAVPAASFVVLRDITPVQQSNEPGVVKSPSLAKREVPIFPRTELAQQNVKNSFIASTVACTSNPVYQNILTNSSMVAAVMPNHRSPPEKKIKICTNDDIECFNARPDTHQLFCDSLVEPLRNLPPKESKLAKMKIMQILYELED